jgi:hypothetical protein
MPFVFRQSIEVKRPNGNVPSNAAPAIRLASGVRSWG